MGVRSSRWWPVARQIVLTLSIAPFLIITIKTACLVEVYSIQHYVIKFVSDLRQVGGFLRVLRFPPSIKLTATIYLLTEILLKVALDTITQTFCLIVGVYWLIVGNVHLYIFICILCLYYIPRSVYELFLNSLTHVTIACVTRGAHNDI